MVMMVKEKIDVMKLKESKNVLNVELVLFTEIQTARTAFEKSYDTYFIIIKEGALTRSHELIFKIEETMLGKHISFLTASGSK